MLWLFPLCWHGLLKYVIYYTDTENLGRYLTGNWIALFFDVSHGKVFQGWLCNHGNWWFLVNSIHSCIVLGIGPSPLVNDFQIVRWRLILDVLKSVLSNSFLAQFCYILFVFEHVFWIVPDLNIGSCKWLRILQQISTYSVSERKWSNTK